MNYIAANLPAINFDATYDFYRMRGFQSIYQSSQGMILNRESLSPNFFITQNSILKARGIVRVTLHSTA